MCFIWRIISAGRDRGSMHQKNNPMILIFLDIDGVMNTSTSCLKHRTGEIFTLKAVLALTWLMGRHPLAHVVITSTRRQVGSTGMQAMRDLLLRNNLPAVAERLIGLTPWIVEQDIDDYREDEIELWLESLGPADRMVILDDKTITGALARYWVGTNSDIGLTMKLAQQADQHLKLRKK